MYDYPEDGIRRTGDPDRGECGIVIEKIEFAQSGTWKCEVLRKQRPGSNKIGSEATNSEFRVDVFRTARVNRDPAKLQGYEENDRNAEIVMEVEVDKDKEEYTDFYWIVHRSLKIYEGEIKCSSSSGPRNNQNCYEALRRKRIGRRSSSNSKKYELILVIDRLEREDLEDRIFLVKDFREVMKCLNFLTWE